MELREFFHLKKNILKYLNAWIAFLVDCWCILVKTSSADKEPTQHKIDLACIPDILSVYVNKILNIIDIVNDCKFFKIVTDDDLDLWPWLRDYQASDMTEQDLELVETDYIFTPL